MCAFDGIFNRLGIDILKRDLKAAHSGNRGNIAPHYASTNDMNMRNITFAAALFLYRIIQGKDTPQST